jgi:hypothetical protein
MHAKDLEGINGITRILLVYTCQQGVYPRGRVLPLRLPSRRIALYKNSSFVFRLKFLWTCSTFVICHTHIHNSFCATRPTHNKHQERTRDALVNFSSSTFPKRFLHISPYGLFQFRISYDIVRRMVKLG